MNANAAAEPLPDPGVEGRSTNKICFMELFLMDSTPAVRAARAGAEERSRVILLHLSGSGQSGWSRCTVPETQKRFDLLQWTAFFLKLKGLSVAEGLDYMRTGRESGDLERRELAQDALLVLDYRLNHPLMSKINRNKEREHAELLIDRSQSYCYYVLT